MVEKIMFVDDEKHVLTSYRRTFRKDYQIVTALGPEFALELFKTKGPFAIVISDMRMPGMNGIQLLSKLKEISPDTIRIMLTGHADFNTAMGAVNEGNIFRFLTKPCPPDSLKKAVQDGLRQYQLIKAEHELLSKTLKGSIKVLIDILSIIDQGSFAQSLKIRDFIRKLNIAKIISANWEIEIAALLSQIGQVTIPTNVLLKYRKQEKLNDVEKELIGKIPQIGHDLLTNIPRLDSIAKAILYQNKRYNGDGFPIDNVKGQDIPLGARIINILKNLFQIEETGVSRGEAGVILYERKGYYDPMLLSVILKNIRSGENELHVPKQKPILILLSSLQVGQMLVESIETKSGQLLVLAGQKITESILVRIKNWAKLYTIKEPLVILEQGTKYQI